MRILDTSGSLCHIEFVFGVFGISAKSKSLSDCTECLSDALSQIPCENAWLRGCIIHKFTRFGADLHDLSLLNNDHTLAVSHCDSRSIGNDVVIPLFVGRTSGCSLLSFYNKDILSIASQ